MGQPKILTGTHFKVIYRGSAPLLIKVTSDRAKKTELSENEVLFIPTVIKILTL